VAASNRESAKPQSGKSFMGRVRSFFAGIFK
jgi:hypothetical protein